jgi:thiamine biosynthesis lipoprotein
MSDLLRAVPALAGAFSFIAMAACQAPPPAQLSEARPLMGTLVEITAEGRDSPSLHRALNTAWAEMERLTAMMSDYDPGSRVSAVSAAAGRHPVAVPPELMDVLRMARRVSERTGGAFDVTIGVLTARWRGRPDEPRRPPPAHEVAAARRLVDWRRLVLDERAGTAYLATRGMRLDLGGIAKLYILNAGLETLRRQGIPRALINAGGDVGVYGGTPARPWRIGIRDPRAPDRLLGVVALEQGFVASSGDYERAFVRGGRRYHHILDPRTGYPTEGPRGVTLMAADLETINGLSAAIMVLGRQAGARLVTQTPGLEGLIVDRDGSVWLSEGMSARLEPLPSS